jgi:hypothetical protein
MVSEVKKVFVELRRGKVIDKVIKTRDIKRAIIGSGFLIILPH